MDWISLCSPAVRRIKPMMPAFSSSRVLALLVEFVPERTVLSLRFLEPALGIALRRFKLPRAVFLFAVLLAQLLGLLAELCPPPAVSRYLATQLVQCCFGELSALAGLLVQRLLLEPFVLKLVLFGGDGLPLLFGIGHLLFVLAHPEFGLGAFGFGLAELIRDPPQPQLKLVVLCQRVREHQLPQPVGMLLIAPGPGGLNLDAAQTAFGVLEALPYQARFWAVRSSLRRASCLRALNLLIPAASSKISRLC